MVLMRILIILIMMRMPPWANTWACLFAKRDSFEIISSRVWCGCMHLGGAAYKSFPSSVPDVFPSTLLLPPTQVYIMCAGGVDVFIVVPVSPDTPHNCYLTPAHPAMDGSILTPSHTPRFSSETYFFQPEISSRFIVEFCAYLGIRRRHLDFWQAVPSCIMRPIPDLFFHICKDQPSTPALDIGIKVLA